MITYKLGSDAETQDIIRMAKAFFEASPYSPLGVDDEEVSALVSQFTKRTVDKLCLCVMDGDKAVGVLGAIAVKNLFNKRLSCVEVMWWIDPEYRGYSHARKMIDVYEYWARTKIHAQVIQLISLPDMDVSALYKRFGFSKKEETYIKEL